MTTKRNGARATQERKKASAVEQTSRTAQPGVDWEEELRSGADWLLSDIRESELLGLRYIFDTTQNPLAAWEARLICREAGLPSPEWVEEYLDGAAKALHELKPEPTKYVKGGRGHDVKQVGPSVLSAFRFGKAKNKNAFDQFRDYMDELDTFLDIQNLIAEGRSGAVAAYAREKGISPRNLYLLNKRWMERLNGRRRISTFRL